MIDLSVIILTRNEEAHIERAIRSLAPLAAQIYVVDSFSTDRTLETARALGATVVQHEFINYAMQYRWALDALPIATEWVMRLDADEVLTPELVTEIAQRVPELPPDVTGVNLRRRHIFMGRWIRHGGRYPLVLLRIWRRGAAQIEQRWMDEHMVLLHGRQVTLEHDFSDHNLYDLTFFTDKHNKYATREAIDVLGKKYNLFGTEDDLPAEGTSVQAAAKRWVKQKIYNRLPFWLGPLSYFHYRYFFQLGFLDGREGLIYHFLQGFWYRFLVGAKIEEFDSYLRSLPNNEAKLIELERLSGYALANTARCAAAERRPLS
jgi:glycosyltransferase involved in cell wall biosynthesis